MKWALVSGAGSGIGKALSEVLAQNGFSLVITARNLKRLEDLASELEEKYGVKVIPFSFDLADHANADLLYERVKKLEIRIDILVNNAGIGDYGCFVDSDIDKLSRLIEVNIQSLVRLTYHFLKDMRENNFGRIVNVASIGAFFAGPLMSVYYASKAFVLSFSEGLAQELEGTDIKVTCLCPGPTNTDFFTKANAKAAKFNMSEPLFVAKKGYQAMKKGKRIEVVGVLNKVIVFSARLLPHRLLTKAVYLVQGHLKERV